MVRFALARAGGAAIGGPACGHGRRRAFRRLLALGALPLLAGCVPMAEFSMVRHHPAEAPVMVGPPVRSSVTPLNDALSCVGGALRQVLPQPIGIGVGDIKDYTGKYNQNEGTAVTQGGALMAYSALGKMNAPIRVLERFDTRIAEAELTFIDRRQLGDGNKYVVSDGNGGNKEVPWAPYYGGTIRSSDYYIVGGITELNYNIQSGGAEFAVNNVGPKARTFTMNIAADLRLVETDSLVVRKTVSLEKQVTGYEVGFNIFRFFDSNLFDVNIGAKNQEPLQLGVRTTIESGVLELVAAIAGIDPSPCLPDGFELTSAPGTLLPGPNGHMLAPGQPPPAPGPQDLTAMPPARFEAVFEPGQTTLSGQSVPMANQLAAVIGAGQEADVVFLTRESEKLGPRQEDALVSRRIDAVLGALAQRGIPPDALAVAWSSSRPNGGFTRDGPGYLEIGRLRIGRR